jgi:CMP-N,N'-diacetyllegionaminic acid synthase
MKLESIAIIPARSGSKGIIDKNVQELFGHPLIAWSILAAKKSNFQDVFVSTDSKEYADIAIKYGAKVPFLRPENLSGDQATDDQFLNHAIQKLKNNGITPNYIGHIRPTTPCRQVSQLNKALQNIQKTKSPYLRSCHKATESPMKWYYKRKNKGISLSEEHLGIEANLPRQLFEDVYIPNGYVDILNVNHFISNQDLYSNNLTIFETEEVVEVDNSYDFKRLEETSSGQDKNIYMELLK